VAEFGGGSDAANFGSLQKYSLNSGSLSMPNEFVAYGDA
jgi:hypothetical protein